MYNSKFINITFGLITDLGLIPETSVLRYENERSSERLKGWAERIFRNEFLIHKRINSDSNLAPRCCMEFSLFIWRDSEFIA